MLELSSNSITGAVVEAIHNLTKLKDINVSKGEVMKLRNVTLGE